MQANTPAVFTRTVYNDFIRFMLASLVVGLVAAMLLSSAVILLTGPKAVANESVTSPSTQTSDSQKRARTTWASVSGAEVA